MHDDIFMIDLYTNLHHWYWKDQDFDHSIHVRVCKYVRCIYTWWILGFSFLMQFDSRHEVLNQSLCNDHYNLILVYSSGWTEIAISVWRLYKCQSALTVLQTGGRATDSLSRPVEAVLHWYIFWRAVNCSAISVNISQPLSKHVNCCQTSCKNSCRWVFVWLGHQLTWRDWMICKCCNEKGFCHDKMRALPVCV